MGWHEAPAPYIDRSTLAADDRPVINIDAGSRTLRALLYRPAGTGPFPAVLYNHGSAPGMQNNQAFEALGPLFTSRGWAFFAPYRRGQGLSAQAGRYVGHEMADARRRSLWRGGALALRVPVLVWFGVLRQERTRIRVAAVVALGLCAAWVSREATRAETLQPPC